MTILAILSLGTFTPTPALAAPAGDNGKDWMSPNGNTWAWNYSPQDQINKNNAQNLEVKWIFPIGSASQVPTALRGLVSDEGATAPPIVRNGMVYILTPYKALIAVDAKTGKQAWSFQYTIDIDAAKKRIPVDISFLRHSHGFK